MIRIQIFILFFISLAFCSKAQSSKDTYADSLENIIAHGGNDSLKARAAFLLCEFKANTDSLQSAGYLQQGRQFSKKYPFLQAISHYYEGLALFNTNRPNSEAAFLRADTLLSSFNFKEAFLFRTKAWGKYGVLQQMKDDEKAFIDILLNKAIPLARLAGDSAYIGKSYLAMGIVFKNEGQFDKAETYIANAIQIYRQANVAVTEQVNAYHTIAENYILSQKYPLAKTMLDSSRALLAPTPESPDMLDYYAAEGMYFTVTEQFGKSLASIEKGVRLAQNLQLRYEEQRLLLQKFYALYNQKSFGKALQVAISLTRQPEMMSLITNRLQLYYGIAETYIAMNKGTKAYQWLKQYSQLSDSLHESRLKNDINAMEIKYRSLENEKKIATLKAENEKTALSLKYNRLMAWLLGIISIFLLTVAVLALLYYRNNKKLSIQKELNHRQHLKEMQQQQHIQLSHAILEGEERERKRVAGDLHDGLGGMLTGVKMNLSKLSVTAPTQDMELAGIIHQLDNSVSELRRIARNMMPEALLRLGLETALKDLCVSFSKSAIQVEFQAFDIRQSIPQQVQIIIYRIIQELLNNAIRHAQASAILLQCSQNKEIFFITVEDNGKGFDHSIVSGDKGMGLGNIRNRVEYLQGKMEITSTVNEGTSINIELNVAERS